MEAIGKLIWAIAEGYIPKESTGRGPELLSHETVCILNTSSKDAEIEIKIYFADAGPLGPYKFTVPAERTRHIRFNDLKDPAQLPKGVDYASVIKSSVPVIVQHTRLDSRQAENALMTTMAYPAG